MLEGGRCYEDKIEMGRGTGRYVCRKGQNVILDNVVKRGLTDKVAFG